MSNAFVEVVNHASTKFTNAAQCDMVVYTDGNSQSIHLGVSQSSNSFVKVGNQSFSTDILRMATGSNATAYSNVRDISSNWLGLSNTGTPVVSVYSPSYFVGSVDVGNSYYTFSNTGASNAMFNIAHSNIFMTDFTIESWVYYFAPPNQISFYGYLIGNMSATADINYWSFGLNSSRRLTFNTYANNLTSAGVFTSNTIALQTWTHIAMSYSNNEKALRLFINGSQQSNLTASNTTGSYWTVSNASSTTASNTGLTNTGAGNGYLTLGRSANSNNQCLVCDFRFKTGFCAGNSSQLHYLATDFNPSTRYTGDYIYPPGVFMGSNTAGFTNKPYGNGIYISSASSFNDANSAPYTAFHMGSGAYFGWTQFMFSYSNGVGGYAGAFNTTASGSNIKGEWLQLQFPQPTICTSYTLVSNLYTRFPKTWAMMGSTDASTWTMLDWITYPYQFSNLIPVTFPMTNSNAYTYYRMVVNSNNGADAWLSIHGLLFNSTSNNLPVPARTNVLLRASPVVNVQTNPFVITNNANVGVNTSNPTVTLDVNGDMNISGIYRTQSPYYWAQTTNHGTGTYKNAVLGFNGTPSTNVSWAYDNTTHRFYFPINGVYFVVIRGVLGNLSGNLLIRKNGIGLTRGHWNHDDAFENVSCQAIITAAVGDYCDCFVTNENTVSAGAPDATGATYGSIFIKYIAS